MDLLFYAGHQTGDQGFIDIATAHAHFVRTNLIREDGSTWHVVNFDPRDGSLKSKHTHQGYSDESTWSRYEKRRPRIPLSSRKLEANGHCPRGQAWTILGFTQTYAWTKDAVILDTAIRLTEYFLDRLCRAENPFPYVPAWDFDAPVPAGGEPLRDSSAGMIAANGMLLLHQALGSSSRYLDEALHIVRDTIALCRAPDRARLVVGEDSRIVADGVKFDAILRHATANNNEYSLTRYSDHGLVYADYYFLEFGNKLLRMGLA